MIRPRRAWARRKSLFDGVYVVVAAKFVGHAEVAVERGLGFEFELVDPLEEHSGCKEVEECYEMDLIWHWA